MNINNKIGYLGVLLTLATITNSLSDAKVVEAKSVSSSLNISERLINIQQKLKEKKQQISKTNSELSEQELLAIFGDFGDSPIFGDFGDVPIFSPGFGDFGDSFPFGDFGDLW